MKLGNYNEELDEAVFFNLVKLQKKDKDYQIGKD